MQAQTRSAASMASEDVARFEERTYAFIQSLHALWIYMRLSSYDVALGASCAKAKPHNSNDVVA